ncbi:MAG: RyR domain-containing protein [Armatimonadetes bacterium]|nr:RyR domain-containing protein [Armatimonadota bacterium]
MSCKYAVGNEDVDFRSLLPALIDLSHPVSRHLGPKLTKSLQRRLNVYRRSGVVNGHLIEELLRWLNRLIHANTLVYDPTKMFSDYVTDFTKGIVAKHPTGLGLCYANRLLLAEAYPCALRTGIPKLVMAKKGGHNRLNPAWIDWQVDKFRKLRPLYESYAKDLLEPLLREACSLLRIPNAIVTARAKGIASFAEKSLRKAKYVNPISQITDLAGARVITEIEEEMERVCDYIRETFVIDEINSVDKRSELRCDEFGYVAVHFVIELDPNKLPAKYYSLAQSLVRLKAEIQVKTILGHAWASISHDRVYKSAFDVPESLKRDLHRVAALLETSDKAFGRAINDLDTFRCYYGAYMTKRQMADEVEKLRIVVRHEPDPCLKASVALHIARIYKAQWNWNAVKRELGPYITVDCNDRWEILSEHGHALCRTNRISANGKPSTSFKRGQKELQRAAERGSKKCRLLALNYLGWSYAEQGNLVDAQRTFRQALELDPYDPYITASFTEFEIALAKHPVDVVEHLRPTLENAIAKCCSHAKAGIEMPFAYLTMGRFHLLLAGYPQDVHGFMNTIQECSRQDKPLPPDVARWKNEMVNSFAAYAAGIQRCLWAEDNPMPVEFLEYELKFLENINHGDIGSMPLQHKWIYELLMLALAVKKNNTSDLVKAGVAHGAIKVGSGWQKRQKAAEKAAPNMGRLKPIVIVAGGAAAHAFRKRHHAYRLVLYEAFDGFRGRLISGGTKAGVPGLVGEIAEELDAKNTPDLEVTGYRPWNLPADAPEDLRYTEFRITRSPGFSFGDPLDTWFDLIVSGVKPAEVRLLGINGGEITMIEYLVALALGATIGVIEASGRAASELAEKAWMFRPGSVIWLPLDNASIRAFVNPGQPNPAINWDELGRQVHESYVEDNKYSSSDLNMQPWHKLRRDLKESNIEQAKYCIEILKRVGYHVRPFTGRRPCPLPDTWDDNIEKMARLEHGRWVAERLSKGWVWGPNKDVEKKINPSLVPWEDLPEETKEYDRKAVRKWPEILASAKLEIYK